MSCYPVLPWTICPDLDHLQGSEGNDPICIPSGANRSDYEKCYYPNETQFNQTICVAAGTNLEDLTSETSNVTIVSSAQQYLFDGVLKIKSSEEISDGLGLPDPALAGCLAVCWLLLYLTLRKGVSSSGKVSYFTAIFPYLVLLTLLVRGLTLPGAAEGLIFLFTPQWEKLASLQVRQYISSDLGQKCLMFKFILGLVRRHYTIFLLAHSGFWYIDHLQLLQ